MASVTYQEKAFLQLMARRVLRFTEEAAARGETYNDLSGFSPLQCGVRLRYVFTLGLKGPIPVVTIKKHPAFSEKDLLEIASDALGAPAKLRRTEGDDLEYLRETDAE